MEITLYDFIAMEEGQMMRFSSDEELGLDSTDTTATDEVHKYQIFFY